MSKKSSHTPLRLFDQYPYDSKETLERATGSTESNVQIGLVKQALDTISFPDGMTADELAIKYDAVVGLLKGINPRDESEGMIAVQMVTAHNSAMECFRRAMIPGQAIEVVDQNLKHAEKLVALHAKLLITLDKHRGKGQQKVTVEYVHVEKGGQAVVGTVNTGKTEKSRNSESPSASADTAAISDAPDKSINFETPQIFVVPDKNCKEG